MTRTNSKLDLFLHAIADPARRRILQALKAKSGDSESNAIPLCAGDIEQSMKLSQPTISHHMRILVKAGLVEVKKEGHWRRYRRCEKSIGEMARALRAQI
jgi:ArsR family transcriptional regulator